MLGIFDAHRPDPIELKVLRLIGELREEMRNRVREPQRWAGSLRRMAFARAVQASNSIEGYDASLDDVVAAVDGEPTVDADAETALALAGYRDAMTYVLQVGQDPTATVDEGLIKSLHFMMLKHDLSKSPGRWRAGSIHVRREPSGEIVYKGPDADAVPGLVQAMVEELEADEGPVLVRAAMAHLNLMMIHPFRDGNGRMARCLQMLVLTREQIVVPVLSSIEEYLGRNTEAYYAVLAEVGRGSWNRHNSARPWIRFCLTAHYRQARTHLRRIHDAEALWVGCVDLVERRGLPERCAAGVVEAAYGFRVRNATYRSVVELTAGETISDLTASRDLRSLVEADLIRPVGQGRGRHYVAQGVVTDVRKVLRTRRRPREQDDPFVLAADQSQLTLG